jgi:DNA repair exonuclease SbcCD nuclease subunit
MALRILATADLHLGMRFAGYPELQERLAEARFAGLEGLVAQANARDCGLLIVAGDLFEQLKMPQREIQRAAGALSGFQGQAAAVLPGNHDYYTGGAGSLWKSFRDNAGDRVVLLSEPRVYDLAPFGLPVRLYAGPCTAKHSREHALGWLAQAKTAEAGERAAGSARAEEDGLRAAGETARIGVAHGAIEGLSPDAQGDYYRMRRSELEAAGLDFWVVGHTHRPLDDADARLFVPGTPEPDGFDCAHEGSALLLEVGRSGLRAERLATGSFRFLQEALELAEGEEPAQALARFHGPEQARTLLRLTLRGLLSAEALARVRGHVQRVRQSVAWLEDDLTGLAERITARRVEAEFARGSFSWLLLQRLLEAGDAEALQQAYALIREVRG